jgi:hypothetical protein
MGEDRGGVQCSFLDPKTVEAAESVLGEFKEASKEESCFREGM